MQRINESKKYPGKYDGEIRMFKDNNNQPGAYV